MKREFRTEALNPAKPGAPRRCCSVRLAVMAGLGLATLLASQTARAADVTITVDAGKQISGNPRFWSTCVGTGTASLTLRPDLQTHYKIGNRELGFLRVRGHGLLNDDMGIYQGPDKYDFSKFDKYLDAIATAKMRPMIELSFMPKALAASGNDRNPPKDYTAWQKLIQAVVKHTVDKYGAEDVKKWYWEVWNEWNYPGFWTGNMEDYHKLYAAAVAGATTALPDILIGGPVTTQGSTSQMTSFLNYAKTNNLRVSFLSSHAYPGGEGNTADANFGVSDNDGRVKVITNAGYTTDKMPSFNTEWNTAYTGQGGNTTPNNVSMDNHVNAPFILKSVKLLADQVKGDKPPLEVFSYWVISDVFGEYGSDAGSYILNKTPNGTLPFGSVFGMMTFQGLRKAAFNGFKMLNYLGDKRLQVSGGTGTRDGVDGMATVSADGNQVQIIVYNYYTTINQTGSDNVTVTVNNLPFAGKEAYITRFAIDEKNANPYSVWVSQNKPSAPTEANWQAMRKAQHLMPVEPVAKKALEGTYTATFAVPKQGAAMIILSLKRPLTGRDAKVEIEGEDYDGQSGVTKEDSADESMGQAISAAANGWVYFENVDYTDEGVDTVQLRVKNTAETSVELRSESETGTVLGKCTLPASSSWATQTCKLSAPATGVSKLYLMFAGAARLNWLKFSGAGGTPTGGSGGNSGTPDGGAGGTTGSGGTSGSGGKGGTSGSGGSTGSASSGSSVGGAGSGGRMSGGTTSGAGQASAGSSGSSSKSSGGSAGQSSSGSGGSSSSSKGSGGSSGQNSSNSGSSSSAAGGSSSGCGCRIGSPGAGSQGTISLLGLLLGVLAVRRRRDWARVSRACLALLAAACSSGCGGGAGGQGGSDSSAGQSGSAGSSSQSGSSGGSAGSSSAGGSSSKASGGSETGGKSESGGSSGAAGSGGKAGSSGAGGAAGAGGTGGRATGGTGGKGTAGGTGGNAGNGGTRAVAGNGGASSGMAGQGGTASSGNAGSTGNPPPTLSLVTTKQGAEWKTDGQLKEVTTNADVTVNDGSPAQDWEGFGAAFNEKGWNYLSMLSEEDRNKTLNLLFAADGANFAWGRIPIGATDYAMDRYTCNETKDDTSMSKFSIDRDKEKLIPFVKAAKAIKTDMRFWASPWTPPTWLKSGPFNTDSPYDGGKMKTDATSLKALADYFVKFVQAYEEQGIKIEIVSPQNEPGYSGTYPTCGWDPTAYASFVGKHLGPALSAANLSVKIMLGTFNGGTGDTNIVSTVMGDSTAKPFIKVLGYQWGMDASGARQYGLPVWQTEHKCGNYPWETYNKEKAPNDHAYAVESWGLIRDWIKKGVTSYSTWNVVLDTVGLGIDFQRVWPQNALLTVDTSAKKLVITPTYYVFRHFSQFVKPGAKVVGTTGGDAVAFKNPDSSIVAVLYNSGAEKTMTVAAGGKKLQFTMPGSGWATVIAR